MTEEDMGSSNASRAALGTVALAAPKAEPSAVRERPILFSAPMVRAILDGRKTQTRRIMNPQPEATDHLANGFSGDACWRWIAGSKRDPAEYYWRDREPPPPLDIRSPYGVPGDALWVKETHAYPNDQITLYRATWREDTARGFDNVPADESAVRWRPSIHMRRRDSRISLRITDVRVERLNDISETDALAEGASLGTEDRADLYGVPGTGILAASAADAFNALWDSINGPESWDENPWVWVVSFERETPAFRDREGYGTERPLNASQSPGTNIKSKVQHHV